MHIWFVMRIYRSRFVLYGSAMPHPARVRRKPRTMRAKSTWTCHSTYRTLYSIRCIRCVAAIQNQYKCFWCVYMKCTYINHPPTAPNEIICIIRESNKFDCFIIENIIYVDICSCYILWRRWEGEGNFYTWEAVHVYRWLAAKSIECEATTKKSFVRST